MTLNRKALINKAIAASRQSLMKNEPRADETSRETRDTLARNDQLQPLVSWSINRQLPYLAICQKISSLLRPYTEQEKRTEAVSKLFQESKKHPLSKLQAIHKKLVTWMKSTDNPSQKNILEQLKSLQVQHFKKQHTKRIFSLRKRSRIATPEDTNKRPNLR